MKFEDKIRETMLSEIGEIYLNHLQDYAISNHNTLRTIYENGILDDESIDRALEKTMLIQMWADFRIVSKNLMPLENIPNLIAYGLKNNLFSKEQCKLIPLDHGDTLQTIVDMYGKNDSVESFRQKLIYPEPRCY